MINTKKRIETHEQANWWPCNRDSTYVKRSIIDPYAGQIGVSIRYPYMTVLNGKVYSN